MSYVPIYVHVDQIVYTRKTLDDHVKQNNSMNNSYNLELYLCFALQASTDQSVLDLEMAMRLSWCAFATIQIVGTIIVMSQVAWEVFAIFIPITGVCIWYQVSNFTLIDFIFSNFCYVFEYL